MPNGSSFYVVSFTVAGGGFAPPAGGAAAFGWGAGAGLQGRQGVCLPSSCGQEDAQVLAIATIAEADTLLNSSHVGNASLVFEGVRDVGDDKDFFGDIYSLSRFCTICMFVLFVVMATILDLLGYEDAITPPHRLEEKEQLKSSKNSLQQIQEEVCESDNEEERDVQEEEHKEVDIVIEQTEVETEEDNLTMESVQTFEMTNSEAKESDAFEPRYDDDGKASVASDETEDEPPASPGNHLHVAEVHGVEEVGVTRTPPNTPRQDSVSMEDRPEEHTMLAYQPWVESMLGVDKVDAAGAGAEEGEVGEEERQLVGQILQEVLDKVDSDMEVTEDMMDATQAKAMEEEEEGKELEEVEEKVRQMVEVEEVGRKLMEAVAEQRGTAGRPRPPTTHSRDFHQILTKFRSLDEPELMADLRGAISFQILNVGEEGEVAEEEVEEVEMVSDEDSQFVSEEEHRPIAELQSAAEIVQKEVKSDKGDELDVAETAPDNEGKSVSSAVKLGEKVDYDTIIVESEVEVKLETNKFESLNEKFIEKELDEEEVVEKEQQESWKASGWSSPLGSLAEQLFANQEEVERVLAGKEEQTNTLEGKLEKKTAKQISLQQVIRAFSATRNLEKIFRFGV